MKKLEKLKKNFVINTEYFEKSSLNEPVYIVDANKENFTAYSTDKKGKISLKEIKIDEKLSGKTFITVKEFFKKCKKDNTEYKVENVDNGDILFRVCYYNDLALFFRISYKTSTHKFILTNMKKFNLIKTNLNIEQSLNKTNLSYLEKEKINRYLSNLKNIKRDYLFDLQKSKENLEKQFKKQ